MTTPFTTEPTISRRANFAVMGTLTPITPRTESGEKFTRIWKDFESRRAEIEPHSTDQKYYGLSFPTPQEGRFDYIAGMAISPVQIIPAGLIIREVPAATYAVFECSVAAIGQTYGHIFGEWRATSGHEVDTGAPAFEEYPSAGDANAPVRIHIAIAGKVAKAENPRRT